MTSLLRRFVVAVSALLTLASGTALAGEGPNVLGDTDTPAAYLYPSGSGDSVPAFIQSSYDRAVGSTSLWIRSGTVLNPGSTFGGFYRPVDTSQLVAGYTYKVSFWLKGLEGCACDTTFRLSHQSGNGDESNLSRSFTLTSPSSWQYVEYTVTLNATKPLLYGFANKAGATYQIDALSIRRIW